MKKSQFAIRTRMGEYVQVDGYIFKFSFYDCEDIFYIGIHKIGSKWTLHDLQSGVYFGAWSSTKKDCVYWFGKKLLNYNRYSILELLSKYAVSELNAAAINSLARCKVKCYYPVNNAEMRFIIGNHWADDTSAIIGVCLRPHYANFNLYK